MVLSIKLIYKDKVEPTLSKEIYVADKDAVISDVASIITEILSDKSDVEGVFIMRS